MPLYQLPDYRRIIFPGYDWATTVRIDPSAGTSASAITTLLTGATVSFLVRSNGTDWVSAAATVEDASARTVGLSLTPAQTALIPVDQVFELFLLIDPAAGNSLVVDLSPVRTE